jgi:outer membrane protein OmpA-like peptidoglycan-associated protein
MMQGVLRFVMIVVPCAVACSHAQPVTAPSARSPFDAGAVAAKPVSPNLAVSGDLDKQCALHFGDRTEAPKFGYDRFALETADRQVLEQVANCLTAGPLKGKKVQLVGRADPRGTDEYNLALGNNRAQTVGDFLTELGVAQGQVAVMTRGALDATGRDERSWQLDRRVDLRLVN